MKALIDGVWHGALARTPETQSRLARSDDAFRGWISANGETEFQAEPGRYHLYVSYACPWAHRTLIYRVLKKLQNVISVSVLHPRWAGYDGWRFEDGPYSTVDHVAGKRFLYEVYQAAKPEYTGRVTVPVLFDRKTDTIVSTESGDIIRMLNTAFDDWGDPSVDFFPEELAAEIEERNDWLLPDVCIGVYKAGFASTQDDYERAVHRLFERLDFLERQLSDQSYLLGDRLSESDWHLFATLVRFDAAYHGALRCNLKSLRDYPALSGFARRLYGIPGVAETVRLDHVKLHYYDAIDEIDPTIVPLGPAHDFRDLGP